ncbi:hypothetical protein ERL59_16585 [Chengkuizengella sp. YPA3-1-1]|uniref:Uncharacterized protein n=1 Tax=Chengkuizengella marina TaxID=2507566 RepID=A0A6N9Q6U3_9BACL|nr:hypothetical protein [Chengkuizengella marina]
MNNRKIYVMGGRERVKTSVSDKIIKIISSDGSFLEEFLYSKSFKAKLKENGNLINKQTTIQN